MSLIDRVRAILEGGAPLSSVKSGEKAPLELRVATAGLLLEMAHHDEEYVFDEAKVILRGLAREFGLSGNDAFQLLKEAERVRPDGGDMSAMTAQIVEYYDIEQRKRIAALAWKVVYADQLVDDAEVTLADRIVKAAGLTPEEALDAREKGFSWFSSSRSSG
jgi:uncharacterized tellurite resistance protein B-like protein